MPVAVGLLVVTILGVVAFVIGQVSVRASEQQRLEERSRLVEDLSIYTSVIYDPDRVRTQAAALPFSPTDVALDRTLLDQFALTPVGEPNRVSTLLARDGTPIAARPDGASVPVEDLGRAWRLALDGESAVSSVFEFDGTPSRATVVPVFEDNPFRPWGVLVTVTDDVASSFFTERFGSFGRGRGGLIGVDSHGVAMYAWDANLIGQQVVDPADLPVGRPAEVVTWTSDGVTNVGAWQQSTGYTTIFQQQTSLLFGDLRNQQQDRDLAITVALGLAVSALVAFGLYREISLRRGRARLTRLLDGVGDLVVLLGPDHAVKFASPASRTLLGTEPGSLIGRKFTELVEKADVERVARLVTDGGAGGRDDGGADGGGRVLDVRLRCADGGERWFDIDASDLSANPHLSGMLLTCHDVSVRRELQEKIARRAQHDPLTGLTNRATFRERLDVAARDAEAMEVCYGILFIDLDRFKPVNDRYGHAAGDGVLVSLVARMSRRLGDDVLVCRLGGDEFGVLLYDTDVDAARRTAQELISALTEPVVLGDLAVQVGASVGVALSGGGWADPSELLRAADRAMYEAKRAGGGRVAVAETVAAVPVDPPDAVVTGSGSDRRASDASHRGPAVEVPDPPDRRLGRFVRRLSAGVRLRAGSRAWWRGRVARRAGRRAGPGRLHGRRAPLGSLAVALAVLAAVVGVGWWQQAQATAEARALRLAEREALTGNVASYVSYVQDLNRLVPVVATAPWSPTDQAANEAILNEIAASPAGGPGSVVALLDTSGGVRAAVPAGVTAPVDLVASPTWQAALDGRPADSPVLVVGGEVQVFTLVPVVRDQQTEAIVMIGRSAVEGTQTNAFEALGAAGLGTGGFSTVDSTGRVGFSWDPELAGEVLVDPADLPAVSTLPAGLARQVSAADGADGQIHIAAPVATVPGTYVVFAQPTDDVFVGVREGQAELNAVLLAMAVVAVAGVAWSNYRREATLWRDEARLDALLHNTHDLIIRIGLNRRVAFVSSASHALLGLDSAQLAGQELTDLCHPDDADRLRGCLASQAVATVGDVRVRRADGAYRWFDLLSFPDTGPGGAGRVVTCHEVSARKMLEDQLSYQADHDPLTGLLNRSAFDRRLATLTTGDSRATVTDSGESTYAVLFVDLDHFKAINDRYSHEAGDEVLRVAAERLRGAAREQDAACRLGGDEFALILTGVDAAFAEQVAARVLASVRQPIAIEGTTLTVSATIGVAIAHRGAEGVGTAEDAETTLRRADRAMYEAKQAGRDRFVSHG